MRTNTVKRLITPKIIFDEKKQVDEMIVSKKFTIPVMNAVYLLARYYLTYDDIDYVIDEKLSPKRKNALIEEKIDRIFPKITNIIYHSMSKYEQIKIEDSIKHIIHKCILKGYRPICDMDYIEVYQSECEYIHQVCSDIQISHKGYNTRDIEKLLFSILCFCRYTQKLTKTDSIWCNYVVTAYFRSANITKKTLIQNLILHDAQAAGLIESSYSIANTSFKAVFLNDIPQEGQIYRISNFDDLGKRYIGIIPCGLIPCIVCGNLIKKDVPRKHNLCYVCLDKIKQQYPNGDYRVAICDVCGRGFIVPVKANKAHRCPQCQKNYIKEYDRKRKRNCASVLQKNKTSEKTA